MRAVAELRVATEDQATRGVSLDAPRAKVDAHATLDDLRLGAVIEDAGLSGKSLARPGRRRALAMLESRAAEALIVMKLDRLMGGRGQGCTSPGR
jgi:DNA invertase Pin-like site-specific DNA recombinase